jgi:hypothetical protein
MREKGELMPDLFDAVAECLREEFRSGRTRAEQGAELKIPARTVAAIVLGERKVGKKALRAIVAANPAWLADIMRSLSDGDDDEAETSQSEGM